MSDVYPIPETETDNAEDAYQSVPETFPGAWAHLERMSDAFLCLDTEWRVTYLNDRADELINPDGKDLQGDPLCKHYNDPSLEGFYQEVWECMQDQEPREFVEWYDPLETWFEVRAYPTEDGLSAYFRDVTARKEREESMRELNEILTDPTLDFQGTLQEILRLGCRYLDQDFGGFTCANRGKGTALIEYSTHPDLDGAELPLETTLCRVASIDGVLDVGDVGRSEYRDLASVQAFDVASYIGECLEFEDHNITDRVLWFGSHTSREELDAEAREFFRLIAQWIRRAMQRSEYQQRLERKREHYDRISDGFFALDEEWRFDYVNSAANEIINPQGRDLIGQEIWRAFPGAIASKFEEEYRRAMDEQVPVSVTEYYPEPLNRWYEARAYPSESGLSVYFRDVTDERRKDNELQASLEVNRLIHEVSDAAIGAKDVDTIKQQTVERLAESDRYLFAWIGTHDEDGVITPEQWAGDESCLTYFDKLRPSYSHNDYPKCPVVQTVQTHDAHPISDIRRDSGLYQWSDAALEHGFESVVSVPLRYNGSLYGTMAVYSPIRGAFAAQETEALDHLTDIIAHAIDAAEQRKALRCDTHLEVEYQSPSIGEWFLEACRDGGVDDPQQVAINYSNVIEAADGEGAVLYGDLTGGDPETIVDIIADFSTVERADVLCDLSVDDRKHEAVCAGEESVPIRAAVEPETVTATFRRVGGQPLTADLSSDAMSIRGNLPTSTDLREFGEALSNVYDDVELVSKRVVESEVPDTFDETASPHDWRSGESHPLRELTDRQQDAIRTAHAAGYFEWPRDSSGTDVAEMMDCSSTTFSQHLRKAEKQVFGALLS